MNFVKVQWHRIKVSCSSLIGKETKREEEKMLPYNVVGRC